MLIREEGNFLVCAFTCCLYFRALLKNIVLESLPQPGISTLQLGVTSLIAGLEKPLLPLHQCPPAHKNVLRKAASCSRAILLPNEYNDLFFI